MTKPPEFDNPPLTEVALSIQVAPLTAFRSGYVGLLWQELRAEYPSISEQAPLDPAFETFGVPQTTQHIRFETFFTVPTPRFWFETTDGQHLLQIQQDRIVHNWRKRGDEQVYPRYEDLRRRLVREIDLIEAFLRRENLGSLAPNQCEATYINMIELPDGADAHKYLSRVTPLIPPIDDHRDGDDFEGATISARFLLRRDGLPIGRTHVTFRPNLLLPDLRPVVMLEVTARGRPAAETIPQALEFLDAAHQAVVRTFEAVTTSEMHNAWRKTDG